MSEYKLRRQARTYWRHHEIRRLIIRMSEDLRDDHKETIEWHTLKLFETVMISSSKDERDYAKRVRLAIANLLCHCFQYGDDVPSDVRMSFDHAYRAIHVD